MNWNLILFLRHINILICKSGSFVDLYIPLFPYTGNVIPIQVQFETDGSQNRVVELFYMLFTGYKMGSRKNSCVCANVCSSNGKEAKYSE